MSQIANTSSAEVHKGCSGCLWTCLFKAAHPAFQKQIVYLCSKQYSNILNDRPQYFFAMLNKCDLIAESEFHPRDLFVCKIGLLKPNSSVFHNVFPNSRLLLGIADT